MANIKQLIQRIQRYRFRFVLIPMAFFAFVFKLSYVTQVEDQSLQPLQLSTTRKSGERKVPINYAVFATSTPNGESYRSYDYAYNVPLTALAWERIGFRSIVLIIGSRCEWENEPALKLILTRLEERRGTAIFVDSPLQYRQTLSQTARIFVANMEAFPGQSGDYLITTDSDLWPLRREHYIPRPGSDIVLVHSACCGYFSMNNKSYQHFPMSNIGASVSTWLQITNDNHSIIARDAESILDYLQEVFGEMARSPVVVGQPAWYMDQHIVSIRIAEWMENHPNRSVHRVSDSGFSRIDRPTWDADKLSPADFSLKFDTHLLLKGYLPSTHARIKPLIHLMYGNDSWETKWIEEYNQEFLSKIKNWVSL
jgi:hypothetical protein